MNHGSHAASALNGPRDPYPTFPGPLRQLSHALTSPLPLPSLSHSRSGHYRSHQSSLAPPLARTPSIGSQHLLPTPTPKAFNIYRNPLVTFPYTAIPPLCQQPTVALAPDPALLCHARERHPMKHNQHTKYTIMTFMPLAPNITQLHPTSPTTGYNTILVTRCQV